MREKKHCTYLYISSIQEEIIKRQNESIYLLCFCFICIDKENKIYIEQYIKIKKV